MTVAGGNNLWKDTEENYNTQEYHYFTDHIVDALVPNLAVWIFFCGFLTKEDI